jgi:hypothetical protein
MFALTMTLFKFAPITVSAMRFAAENVGCRIAWVGSTREVIIVFAK